MVSSNGMLVNKLTTSNDESEILMYGLKFSIPPERLSKTDILSTFEKIHSAMVKDIKENADKASLKAQLSFLANSYHSSYKPTKATLKKHGVIKKLRRNKNIVITHPDKGEGVIDGFLATSRNKLS